MTLNPPAGVARPAPPPKPPLERIDDALRVPMVRQSMHMFIPAKSGKTDRIEVREIKAGVRLYLDKGDDGIGVAMAELSISEANKLSEILNVIRRRVVDRAEWRP